MWIRVIFVDMPLHVLDDHDGIIHHQAGGQRDAEHGERIDRKTEYLDERKCSDQGYRDGDRGDDRCAPVEQEEKDHDNDDDDGFAQRPDHFTDGISDDRGGVERNLVLHPWRKRLGQVVQGRFSCSVYRKRIGVA